MDHILSYLDELKATLATLDLEAVKQSRNLIGQARQEGKQLFLCGNGGSATTASHMANDLGKGASYGRPAPERFRVMALTDNVAWITALANDVGYWSVYAEQLRNLGQPGDVLLAISPSGDSPNVLRAVSIAKKKGMRTIGWCGNRGAKLAEAVDLSVMVDSHHPGRVEDLHLILMHLVCYYFMEDQGR